MINEDKIREVWASDPERGFKLLIDFFQQPIYWHIRRLVVSHEDAEDILHPLDEIAYLETAGRKTAVHTREERIEYTVPLSKLKEEFQKQGFCLSHFSYLVNLAHVARVERDALTLDTGEAIPVSRRYYQDFMARYVESLK